MTIGLHLICVALVAADIVARSWRTQLMVHGVGNHLTFWRSFAINSFGDAAATLTPLRVAGQPARVLALVHDGVPLEAALVALSVEAVITYATVALCGLALVVAAVPDWWATVGSATATASGAAWPWAVGSVLLLALFWAGWQRRRRGRGPDDATGGDDEGDYAGRRSLGRRLGDMWSLVRLVPLRSLLLAIPLSVVNVVARVAILPLLAQLLAAPPSWGALWLASFALLYGQLVVPTPAGAGVVDAGFLAGAAAVGGDEAGRALLWWRLYSSGVGLALGLLLGAPRYGVRPLIRAVRYGLRRPTVTDGGGR